MTVLVTAALLAGGSRADEPEEFDELGPLECTLTHRSCWVVYSRAEFECNFLDRRERYLAVAVKRGLNLKWKFGEGVDSTVFKLKKRSQAPLDERSLAGKYKGLDIGLALVIGGDFFYLKGGKDENFVLQSSPDMHTGLGIEWTFDRFELTSEEEPAPS